MRVLAVLVGLYGLVHAVPLSAQPVQDCTPPAVKDGIDRGMPCYQHPPALGVETQVRFARGSAVVTGEARPKQSLTVRPRSCRAMRHCR